MFFLTAHPSLVMAFNFVVVRNVWHLQSNYFNVIGFSCLLAMLLLLLLYHMKEYATLSSRLDLLDISSFFAILCVMCTLTEFERTEAFRWTSNLCNHTHWLKGNIWLWHCALSSCGCISADNSNVSDSVSVFSSPPNRSGLLKGWDSLGRTSSGFAKNFYPTKKRWGKCPFFI